VAITQYILGIRPTYDGLMVAPVIPTKWQSFSVSRVFQGVWYNITVTRAGKGNRVRLTVDGLAVEGNVIPKPRDGGGGGGGVGVREKSNTEQGMLNNEFRSLGVSPLKGD